jgi:hypothetical protein
MNCQQLRSIREAARRNYNLTEVANALYTSQPGVSRQIRELEDELGVIIFERNGKRLTGLTEPGKGILKIVERLLVEAENLQQASLEYAGQSSGTLTIARAMRCRKSCKASAHRSRTCVSPCSKARPNTSRSGSCPARPISASPPKVCRSFPTWCRSRATAGVT